MNKTTLQSAVLGIALACAGIGVTGCAVTDGQSSMGQYVDDKTIATRVKTKFATDDQVSAMRLQVESLNGTVELSGFATSQAEKNRAAEIARNVPDVKSVHNNIIVRPPEK